MDKQYLLTVPSYHRTEEVIIYEFLLEDTIINKTYTANFRFKDLQDYHKKLSSRNLKVPNFPKTHFWRKTNKDPVLIEERRAELQKYFDTIVNDPLIRGHGEVKSFISRIKREKDARSRGRSQSPRTSCSSVSRKVKSLDRSRSQISPQYSPQCSPKYGPKHSPPPRQVK